jgi:hypothetical protein
MSMIQPSENVASRPAAARTIGRNGLIDALRFFAAAGIVIFHAKAPGAAIGYAALPLFTIYLAHFATSNLDRAVYFFRLWLIWSLIYGSLKVADSLLSGGSWQQEFVPSMILTGPSIHLWFLPFAAVVVLLIDVARRVFIVPAALVASVLAFWGSSQGNLAVPLSQWIFVLPSLAFGIVLYRRSALPAAAIVIAVAWAFGWTSGLLQFAIAICLAVATKHLFLPATWLTDRMRDSALGIYLIHPIFISVFERIGVVDPATLAALSIVASALAVFFLRSRLPALF